jgi:hypothetical protein
MGDKPALEEFKCAFLSGQAIPHGQGKIIFQAGLFFAKNPHPYPVGPVETMPQVEQLCPVRRKASEKKSDEVSGSFGKPPALPDDLGGGVDKTPGQIPKLS